MAKTPLTQEDCHRIIRDLNRDAPPNVFVVPADHIVIDFVLFPNGVKFNEDVSIRRKEDGVPM